MSGRSYGFSRSSRPQRGQWGRSGVRSNRGNNYQGDSWQSQQRKQNQIYAKPRATSTGANGIYDYGERRRPAEQRTSTYDRSLGDVRTSRQHVRAIRTRPQIRAITRASLQPTSRVRSRSNSYSLKQPTRSFRQATQRVSTIKRTIKTERLVSERPERPRKRFHTSEGFRRETKRARVISSPNNWSKKIDEPRKPRILRLMPANLILASGIPGEDKAHLFLSVKFQSHPFIRPRASISLKTAMMTFEVVEITKYSGLNGRLRCEFSILQRDIASIIAFEGDRIPEDITKRKSSNSIDETSKNKPRIKGEKISDDEEEVEEELDPESMTSEDLRQELDKRGQESRGLKAELIKRLKESIAQENSKNGTLVLQTVDPSALFVHVESEGEDREDRERDMERDEDVQRSDEVYTEEEMHPSDIGQEDEIEKDGSSMDNPENRDPEEDGTERSESDYRDQNWRADSERDGNYERGGHTTREIESEAYERGEKNKQISENEDNLERCYAYVSGFHGRVEKKALFNTFSEFGNIVEMKQVAKKCRIQYDTPAAVDKLLNRDPPLEFNDHIIMITRELDPPSSVDDRNNRESTAYRRDNDQYSEEEVRVDSRDVNEFATGREVDVLELVEDDEMYSVDNYSDDEVEDGRGDGKKVDKKKVAKSKKATVKATSKKKKTVSKKKTVKKKTTTLKRRSARTAAKAKKDALKAAKEIKKGSGKKKKNDILHRTEQQQEGNNAEAEHDDVVYGESVKKMQIENGMNNSESLNEAQKNITESRRDKGSLDFFAEKENVSLEYVAKKDLVSEQRVEESNKIDGGEIVDTDLQVNEVGPEKCDEIREEEVSGDTEMGCLEYQNEPDEEMASGESETNEESQYKDKVGFKDGKSMLEHLKHRASKSDPAIAEDVLMKGKAVDDDNLASEKMSEGAALTKQHSGEEEAEDHVVSEKDKHHQREQKQQSKNFSTTSYRVVITLKRPPRVIRRADTLLSRDILHNTRIIILEFALTPKNREPKNVFDSVMETRLEDVANGDIWPESGALSFKHTVTTVLTQMQTARSKVKRLSSAEAMFEENQELKKNGKVLEDRIKNLEEEVESLGRRIKKARGFLA